MAYSVKGVFFSYGKNHVVSDISFSLEQGCFYGLLGPNGSGKTTLLDILVRYRKPSEGTVQLFGKSLSDYSVKSLAANVALVAQNQTVHFPYTVKDLVLMGRYPYMGRFRSPSSADLDAVYLAMNTADVTAFADIPVTELSGGERQRVMIARALAQDTPVLLLDEATSNLDIFHSLSLLDSVKRTVSEKGKTVVSVFHDINLAALFCDHLLLLSQGRICRSGSVDEVLTDEAIYEVYNVSAKVEKALFSGVKQVVFSRDSFNIKERSYESDC